MIQYKIEFGYATGVVDINSIVPIVEQSGLCITLPTLASSCGDGFSESSSAADHNSTPNRKRMMQPYQTPTHPAFGGQATAGLDLSAELVASL